MGLPDGSDIKNPPANAEDSDSMPDLGRSPGKGNSCLRNPMVRGAWWATGCRVRKELGTEERQQWCLVE